MKRLLQNLALLLAALMVPATATAAFVQLADGVYRNGSTLYICSNVTSLGNLQVNPSVIYSFATVPPTCSANTFTGYNATLHMPPASYGAYFVNEYWGNFSTMYNDAVEPTEVTISSTTANIIAGETLTLTANVTPTNASLRMVEWSSTDPSVATVSGGTVTAVNAGECDIVATCLYLQAVCHVTVIETTITITLDQHEARLLPNHSITLTPTMSPQATSLKVTVSNPEVAAARLVNGVVQVVGLAEGTTMIVVSSVDGQAVPDACMVTVYTELGDVNSDGFVNMDDLTTMINYLLTDDAIGVNLTNADTNQSGGVTMDDLTTLINYLLTDQWPWDEPGTQTFTVNGVTFKMVVVKGGTFMMGASDDDPDAYNKEKPAHQVTLSSFSIGETKVTQALWLAVMGSNPSYFSPTYGYAENLQRPAECVSWNDCQEFITKLNQMTGKNFRLPTEAEWEYAARGGKKSQGNKYAGSNDIDAVAWYRVNAYDVGSSSPDYGTHTVATKAPNELGLYDMSGNVWELCQDWYDSYSSEAQTNPTGPASGSNRVARGGGWYFGARDCRVSNRLNRASSNASSGLGLRLALDPESSPKFRLSETVVELDEGETATVDILNGSGSYSVAGGTDYVNSTVNGETLTVTGTALGTTTVHVTDNTTGVTTVLIVIVEPAPIIETFTVNDVSFKMIEVKGGTFTMGATGDQGGDANSSELPTHQVTLSGYCIGETEVTQALWQAVIGSNPSYFTPTNGYAENLQRPVENVSWSDCQTFITKLNQMTGKNFRLPTEAEWEYAARGGKKSQGYKYAGSNDINTVAWYIVNALNVGNNSPDYGTHTVATKAPNELGLYDMSGNVWEWCQDCYGSYNSEAQTNPIGPDSGSLRVLRGGGWNDLAKDCRVSRRGSDDPADTEGHMGLRLAL